MLNHTTHPTNPPTAPQELSNLIRAAEHFQFPKVKSLVIINKTKVLKLCTTHVKTELDEIQKYA